MKTLLFSALLNLDIDCNTVSLHEVSENIKWKKDVCEKYFSDYLNVKIRAIRTTSKKVGVLNEKKFEVSQPIAGRVIVKRIVDDGNAELILITTFYAIDAFKEVWIAHRNIKQNEILTERDITKEVKNIGNVIGVEHFPDKNPKGAFIGNSLTKGQIIYSSYLSDKPLIEIGKEVSVVFASGGLKLNMKGVALHNGFMADDAIKIRLLDTGKIFTGKIKDNETVTVDI